MLQLVTVEVQMMIAQACRRQDRLYRNVKFTFRALPAGSKAELELINLWLAILYYRGRWGIGRINSMWLPNFAQWLVLNAIIPKSHDLTLYGLQPTSFPYNVRKPSILGTQIHQLLPSSNHQHIIIPSVKFIFFFRHRKWNWLLHKQPIHGSRTTCVIFHQSPLR